MEGDLLGGGWFCVKELEKVMCWIENVAQKAGMNMANKSTKTVVKL